ncbi:rhomboid family intramembrane serine protease [Corynebacterium glucuronolyticum]|uniref:rhomboid family intramembrane serine protease n=1 Tax=Corynebacterium glucuronolyticum TaxID=39791 RepID=UPI00019C1ECA|nr:rhomboid family intramembrane serine protease [Corynebacterium glucuronolyticum]EEI27101.1 peptidase, S54 family [Corynebacterium glucuronolyticum ATCC 51867]QRO82668.1 rhomboid family intramembrane serine protease [Corynebacterium glucuronolyticum]
MNSISSSDNPRGGYRTPGYTSQFNQYGQSPLVPGTPVPAPQQPRQRGGIKVGLRIAVGFVIVIWAVFIATYLTGGFLSNFGIHPLDPSSLPFILTSPLLHANLSHIISNTMAGAVFAFLVGCSGKRVFWEVTLICTVIGGFGTWVFGGIGTNHIGASGVIYGWLAYLIVRGIFNKSLREILLGVVLAFTYSGLIWGVLPADPSVSWQGHLFGAIGGILCGIFLTSDDPIRPEKTGVQQG